MASIGLHGLKLVAIHLSLFFGPKWTFCTVCLCKIVQLGNFESFKFGICLGHTYDISNKHRLGYSEVQLVQTMIDGVNTLWKEDLELQKKHGM